MGIKKDLNSYFDEWIYIHCDTPDDEFAKNWCFNRFGVRGLKWDLRYTQLKNNKLRLLCYCFEREQDAMMFILMFGGNIVQKYQ